MAREPKYFHQALLQKYSALPTFSLVSRITSGPVPGGPARPERMLGAPAFDSPESKERSSGKTQSGATDGGTGIMLEDKVHLHTRVHS